MQALACNGTLDEPFEGGPAGAREAGSDASWSLGPCEPDGGCAPDAAVVEWFALDGGLVRCACAPGADVPCMPNRPSYSEQPPPVGPLGDSICTCAVCGPMPLQTWRCTFDPYFGDTLSVSCVE